MQRFHYKQNRFKQLRAFCNTARAESMSKAAEQMFLSQPSITLLIQALEKDLDSHLFDRQGPKLHLTNEGKILLELRSAPCREPGEFAGYLSRPLSQYRSRYHEYRRGRIHNSVSSAPDN